MALSRRNFLGSLGAGTAAALVAGAIPDVAFAGQAPRGSGASDVIILARNENPYGQFPSVQAALRGTLGVTNRYAVGGAVRGFEEQVAAYHKVKREQVLLGNGSTEVLAMAAHAFTGPGRPLVTALPTFEAPAHYAKANKAENVQVPLTSSFAHDLDAMLAKGKNGGLFYICNPNNPTASLTPRSDIDTFLQKLPGDAHVLIDEAYHHFAMDAPEYTSFLDKPVDDPRVIVARTFSKVYAMAGLRLGYGISTPATIRQLEEWKLDTNINTLVLAGAAAALNDDAAMRAAVARNAADRARFMKEVDSHKLTCISCHANFAMVETGRPVQGLIDYYRKNNVQIGRPFPPMLNYARVTFGKPDEMEQFWKLWDQMPAAHAS